jgi:transposase
MTHLNLTSWERRLLRRQRGETLDARVLRRTLAVLEFDRGRSAAEIAELLGVTRQSIYNWLQAFRQDRQPKTLQDKSGRGRPRAIDEEEEHLLESLLASSPQHYGYPHANWTVALLQEALAFATETRGSLSTLRRTLWWLNYVWKRPRYDLLPDPKLDQKNVEFVGKSGVCRVVASC